MGQANVRGHKTGGEKNDMDIGVNALAILLENGKFVIPYDSRDPRTTMLCSKLVDEMRSWPDGHTGDSLMAAWFAYLEARDLVGKRFIFAGLQTPSSMITTEEIAKEELKVDLAMIKESDEARQSGRSAPKKFVF
jgi:hypothetical protein